MDLNIPGIGGIEGVKIIKTNDPSIKVVIQTVFDDDARIFDCICAGVPTATFCGRKILHSDACHRIDAG